MKRTLEKITVGVSLAIVAMSFTPKTEAHMWRIDQYDAITNTYAKIKNGTIDKYVRPQYLTVRDGVTIMDEGGYKASLKVLNTKYAPACEVAGCSPSL